MKFCIFLVCVFLCKFSYGSHDLPYGASSGYPGGAVSASGQGWNAGGGGGGGGHSAGSYYHYHVPLVGQQQHSYHPPQPQPSNDLHHTLLWVIPLLLLALGPLLLLPLLSKLFLIPVGLSLLGLLLPLLMMGGMMMMMMMGGGMMMMPMRNGQQVTTARGLAQLLITDWSELGSMAARAIDFDKCPEKVVCTLGTHAFAQKTSVETREKSELLLQYVIEQAPRGKLKKLLRKYKEAFWSGSKAGDCSNFTCQPSLRWSQDQTGSLSNGTSVSHSESSRVNHQSHVKVVVSSSKPAKINNKDPAVIPTTEVKHEIFAEPVSI